MSTKKIRIDGELHRRAKAAAETAGYSSVEEFVEHVLSRELGKIEGAVRDSTDKAALKERLKGLGYIS